MKFLVLPLLFAVAMGAEMAAHQAGDAYGFHYATGDAGGHSRSESGHGNSVTGSYSYVDPNGDLRTVHYSAGPDGFKASGDTGVDRKTAAAAAAMNALAPKAPVAAPAPYVPTHHAYHYSPYHHGGVWAHHGIPNYAHWGAHW